MFSVALILLLAAGSCVKCIDLIQPDSKDGQPGQSLTFTCQVSGYSLTDNSYATGWIRQSERKSMEWIWHRWGGGDVYKNDCLKNKFLYQTHLSTSSVTLTIQDLQPEDSAVYYCVRAMFEGWVPNVRYAFDLWGSGTEVTVCSESLPTLFPVVLCSAGPEGKITLGCLAQGFYPKRLTFQWTDASGTSLSSVEHPPGLEKLDNKFPQVSLVHVSKSDWDSGKSFTCSTNDTGRVNSEKVQKRFSLPQVTLISAPKGDTQALVCIIENFFPKELTVKWKKNAKDMTGFTTSTYVGNVYSAILMVSNTDWDSNADYTCEVTHRQTSYTRTVSKAPVTVTLNQPWPKEIFNNRQAKLECIVTGRNEAVVKEFEITWQIDGRNVTSATALTQSGGQHSKTSTVTYSRTQWLGVNKVRCTATKTNMAPIIRDLMFHRGAGQKPEVTVHVLSDEVINNQNSDKVTLVCLVSSPVLQDYYIAWSEDIGQKNGNYMDGVSSPPQKTQNGYSVTSVYTTTKGKWQSYKFTCSVWPDGSSDSMTSQAVSKAQESKLSFALSCTDDAMEEDEFSSLWFTTSSFIFLFISSLFYSMIISLVKMKRQ